MSRIKRTKQRNAVRRRKVTKGQVDAFNDALVSIVQSATQQWERHVFPFDLELEEERHTVSRLFESLVVSTADLLQQATGKGAMSDDAMIEALGLLHRRVHNEPKCECCIRWPIRGGDPT